MTQVITKILEIAKLTNPYNTFTDEDVLLALACIEGTIKGYQRGRRNPDQLAEELIKFCMQQRDNEIWESRGTGATWSRMVDKIAQLHARQSAPNEQSASESTYTRVSE